MSEAGITKVEQAFQEKVKVHQAWSKCYGAKASKESSKTEIKKRNEELRTFEKLSVTNSDQESINSSSSEEGEVWKLGSGGRVNFTNNHSSKKLK